MTSAFDAAHVIASVEGLRALYRAPSEETAEKKEPSLEPWGRACIEASPFVFVATADALGRPTVSPKGGSPGFVRVLDERRLALPDYAGNNLIDSLRNIVANPTIGLIFVLPGRGETFRVDGEACITTDPAVLAACEAGGRRARTAIGITIRECFLHCSSSFSRGRLWDPSSWREDASRPFTEFVRHMVPVHEQPEWIDEAFEDDDLSGELLT